MIQPPKVAAAAVSGRDVWPSTSPKGLRGGEGGGLWEGLLGRKEDKSSWHLIIRCPVVHQGWPALARGSHQHWLVPEAKNKTIQPWREHSDRCQASCASQKETCCCFFRFVFFSLGRVYLARAGLRIIGVLPAEGSGRLSTSGQHMPLWRAIPREK